ncbi:hypothetical protein MASR2M78_10940 [Treponema sp.]
MVFLLDSRAEILDFKQYAEAFMAVLQARPWPKPWRVVAHSTGCATTLFYLHEQGNPFEKIVFEAPLVRTFLWKPSLFAIDLLKNAIDTLPRRNVNTPYTRELHSLILKDPLYVPVVPISWFDALEAYVSYIQNWESMDAYVLILQGRDDSVVDAAFNIPFLQVLLPRSELIEIEGGHHHLLLDAGPSGEAARAAVRAIW